MRKLKKTLSELSGGYDEEDQQLLNPDEKPADFGISLTQLRHLTEVRFTTRLCRHSGLGPEIHKMCRQRAKRSLHNWGAFQALQKLSSQISVQA